MDMQQQDLGESQTIAEPPPDEGEATLPPADLPLEAYNLVPDIEKQKDGPEWLEKEGKKVVELCGKDEEARKEFMDRRANQLKLYAGILKPLDFPTEGAKAPHLPILLQAMLSLWSRIWDQICPAKGDIVHVQVTGPEDEPRRMRVEKHMNWQVRTKMPEWASSQAASIMQWLLSGSSFRHYCWNPIEERNQIDHVPIDDMVIPYAETDLHPLMPNVSRKTRKRRLPKHVILQMEEKGYFSGITALYGDEENGVAPLPTGNSNYTDVSKVREIATTIDGIKKPDPASAETKDPDAPREFLEQHKWMEIFGTKKLRPVIITVDCATKKPVSLTLREIDDPVDRQRFDLEQKEFDLSQSAPPPMPQPGMPPQEPITVDKPKPCKKKTLHNIIHSRLFPNPEGFYGLGAGYLLENSNDLVDSLIADVLVAGKFQNMPMGFISKHAQGSLTGDVKMSPGMFKSIDCQPDEMDKAVKPFTFGAPSQTLVKLAQLLMDKAETQAANQEILSGEQGGSRETAKSMQIRQSNAMTVVNVMTRLYLEPLKYEFKCMAHGNSVFLSDQEYFYVTEPSKQVPGVNETQQHQIGRADYLEDYDITFTADARVSSKPERVSDATGLLDKLTQMLPALMQSDPQRAQLLMYIAMKHVFTEMEKPDFLAAMGQPPAPPPPPTPMNQYDENAGFLNEKDHPVLADDVHLEHLAKIETFEQTPHFKAMTSTGKQMLDKHKRAHVAASYQQMQQHIEGAHNGQVPEAGMGGRPGGAGGIPGRPGNGQGPQGPGGMGAQPGGAPAGPVPNGASGGHPL